MIHIVTDTLAGIPATISSQLNMTVIPQYIIIDDRSYRDDFEISPSEIVARMKKDGHLPHTAAPPPSLYYPVFS
ncbi:MAG TPA: DegV family protein, partial [Anaerolineaceae bacterium]|nr:DegV family protein [Anaerolineaceae bacterium]